MPKRRESSQSLFARLARLFRSGPVVKRKVRAVNTSAILPDQKSSGMLLFQKAHGSAYASITSQAYNMSERLMRYQDFQEMEYTPELASALDIYADETMAQDEKGRVLHIHSDNPRIKDILEDLFYDTLNIDFNGRPWVRNACKYGDMCLYIDVSAEHGVLNVFPIAINEIEREENYDPRDPFAVRYKWITGNRRLENWEVAHFRLLGNDMFLPYGTSVLEAARRIWRQLILIEDAMLVYRITRAPERRVFYFDVGNMPPEAIPAAAEELKMHIRANQVTDARTGRVDLRYNPMSVDEDYYIPVRGNESGTKIDTLAGGQNTAAVEDVEYIQKKMFAAIKIPRAYLGYDEMLSSKATLAQEDIRFSRTIAIIQKMVIAELNKIAIIHLFANGFETEDLLNFTLKLSNPSTVAQQQKLELMRARFEIAGSAPEGLLDKKYLRREVLDLSEERIREIDENRLLDKQIDDAIDAAEGGGGGGAGGGGGSLFGGGGGAGGDLGDLGGGDEGGDLGDLGGGDEGAGDAGGGEAGGDEEPEEDLNAGEEPEEDEDPGIELLTGVDDPEHDGPRGLPSSGTRQLPIKPGGQLARALHNRSRRRTHGASKTHMPDFGRMVSVDHAVEDPTDSRWFKAVVSDPFGEGSERTSRRLLVLSADTRSMLERMARKLGMPMPVGSVSHDGVLAEEIGRDVQDLIDAGAPLGADAGLLSIDAEVT